MAIITRKGAIGALNSTVCEAMRAKSVQSYTQWYKGVVCLNRPYGLLLGNIQGPRNWRYILTDELLRTLVYCVRSIVIGPVSTKHGQCPQSAWMNFFFGLVHALELS